MENRSQRVSHVYISERSTAGTVNRSICGMFRKSKEANVPQLGSWKETGGGT